jgi:CxxC motif-containing protein
MTTKKRITCIVCPIGCEISIEVKENKCKILNGNKCDKGIEYSINEALNPRRMLTTSILIKEGIWPLVSVKTSDSVPKEEIFKVLNKIKKTIVFAPVKSGQILIKNVADNNIYVIATKTIEKI